MGDGEGGSSLHILLLWSMLMGYQRKATPWGHCDCGVTVMVLWPHEWAALALRSSIPSPTSTRDPGWNCLPEGWKFQESEKSVYTQLLLIIQPVKFTECSLHARYCVWCWGHKVEKTPCMPSWSTHLVSREPGTLATAITCDRCLYGSPEVRVPDYLKGGDSGGGLKSDYCSCR